ncbi:MAG: hypothetical protein P8Y51_01110, partial [Campylobacterales bacterium]
LNEQRLIYVSLFNLDSGAVGKGVRFALLLPERVIGRYAASTTNSVLAYLLGKNRDFELKTFQIGDESPDAIRDGLAAISREHFNYAIAPLTKRGAETVAQLRPQCNVFFPTVNAADLNRSDANASGSRLYFGGIDYRKQIGMLMQEAVAPLIIFYDTSALGRELKDVARSAYLERFEDANPLELEQIEKEIHTYPVDKHTTNLKRILEDNERIKKGTFFLNTPLVKSGMIMSQLTLYDVNATRVLSTQINYDAMLFDITQPQDRENMIVANSIGPQNSVLVEGNKLLQNDILYAWINYATSLGIDSVYHLSTRTPREYAIPIEGHQIAYPVTLFHPAASRFEPYLPVLPEEEEDFSIFEE